MQLEPHFIAYQCICARELAVMRLSTSMRSQRRHGDRYVARHLGALVVAAGAAHRRVSIGRRASHLHENEAQARTLTETTSAASYSAGRLFCLCVCARTLAAVESCVRVVCARVAHLDSRQAGSGLMGPQWPFRAANQNERARRTGADERWRDHRARPSTLHVVVALSKVSLLLLSLPLARARLWQLSPRLLHLPLL